MVSHDLITSLHTFIGGFFPVFPHQITSLEILDQNNRVSVSFRADVSYDLLVDENATVKLHCGWMVDMGDPDWPKKIIDRLKKCVKEGMIPDLITGTKRKGLIWDCDNCEQ